MEDTFKDFMTKMGKNIDPWKGIYYFIVTDEKDQAKFLVRANNKQQALLIVESTFLQLEGAELSVERASVKKIANLFNFIDRVTNPINQKI